MKISLIWSTLLVALFLIEIAIAVDVPAPSGNYLIKRAPPRLQSKKTTQPGKTNPIRIVNKGNRVTKPVPNRNTKGAQNNSPGACKPIPVPASEKWYCGYKDPKAAPGAVNKPRPATVTFSATQINDAMSAAKTRSGRYPAGFTNEDRTKASRPPMFPGKPTTSLKEFPIYAPGATQPPGAFRVVYHHDPASNDCTFVGITEHPLSSSGTTIACMNTPPLTRRSATIKKVNI